MTEQDFRSDAGGPEREIRECHADLDCQADEAKETVRGRNEWTSVDVLPDGIIGQTPEEFQKQLNDLDGFDR